ncbi:MAG TPA: GNAT family N-acetyltransferase [Actinomycetota bacterium]|jgi:ribosomal protein S18 acetylase RimI-like enzyme|nr:GNAT family N-acetyltransferase [Actinomycetota bacterium]
MIEVRPVRPSEQEEAGRVTALAYREFARPGDPDWDEYLVRIADVPERNGRTLVLVAVEEGDLLGSVTLELDGRTEPGGEPLAPHEAHIRMLGVHPDHRRRGVARELIHACFDRARAAGKTRVTLNTTTRMEAAQRMYETLGFRRTADRVFPDGFVLLGFERPL